MCVANRPCGAGVSEAQALFVVSVIAAFCCGKLFSLLSERDGLRDENDSLRQQLFDKTERLEAVLASFAPPAVSVALGVAGAQESVEQREFDARVAKREAEAMFSSGV